ncbi:MAG: VPLPA-CTERM sorting domain-containing protein [Pseudomonadota bacterium]
MRIVLTTLAIAAITSSAHATTVFETGINETLSNLLNDDVVVRNGTQLTIDASGQVIGAQVPAFIRAPEGVIVEDTSSVTLNGGSITGGQELNGFTTPGNSFVPGDGATGVATLGTSKLIVNSGSISGRDGQSGLRGGDARSGLRADFDSMVTITGGTISGGIGGTGDTDASSGDGGDAALFLTRSMGQISGGVFTGGTGRSGGDGLTVFNDAKVSVSGGTFTAGAGTQRDGWTVFVSNRGRVDISGGTFNSAVNGLGTSPTVFAEQDAIINLSGGTINGPVDLFGRAVLNLRGGEINGEIDMFGTSVLNVFGEDLAFMNGLLSGTLRSGQSVDGLRVNVFDSAVVNLFETAVVPVPASLPLMVSGLAAFALLRRRRSMQASI